MKYKIMVTIPFGMDDTFTCEYNGVEYDSFGAAAEVYDKIPVASTYGEILNKFIVMEDD